MKEPYVFAGPVPNTLKEVRALLKNAGGRPISFVQPIPEAAFELFDVAYKFPELEPEPEPPWKMKTPDGDIVANGSGLVCPKCGVGRLYLRRSEVVLTYTLVAWDAPKVRVHDECDEGGGKTELVCNGSWTADSKTEPCGFVFELTDGLPDEWEWD